MFTDQIEPPGSSDEVAGGQTERLQEFIPEGILLGNDHPLDSTILVPTTLDSRKRAEEGSSRMTVRAVLFDVGGPLDTEEAAERSIDEQIRARLADHGVARSPAEFAAANDWAVSVFAPNAYTAIIWRLCAGQPALAAALSAKPFAHRSRELRPGVPDLLLRLHNQGVLLGLAANQPADIIAWLDGEGVGNFFSHREVSGHHGYRKPDVRLFLRACEDLGVEPDECVMVGDRIDNDVVPAKLLGMSTILFRTGRHIAQQPRAFTEVPDAEVTTVAQLEQTLETVLTPRAG